MEASCFVPFARDTASSRLMDLGRFAFCVYVLGSEFYALHRSQKLPTCTRLVESH